MATKNVPNVTSSPVAPTTAIVLGGEERHFKYDLNALVMIEENLGIDIFKAGALDLSSVKQVRYLIYAGLLHENDELTEKQVGSWITAQDMVTVGEAIQKALGFAMPEVEEVEDGAEGVDDEDPNAPIPINR